MSQTENEIPHTVGEIEPVQEEEPVIPSLASVSNVAPPQSKATDPGEFPCEDCAFIAKNKLGLAKHRSARHGVMSAQKKAQLLLQSTQGGIELVPSSVDTQQLPPVVQEQDDIREEEFTQLKILERKFGAKLNYKSFCTQDTPVSKIKQEKKVLLDLINSKCTTDLCFKAILGASSTLELASQHQRIKPMVDLRGLHNQYETDKQEISEAIEEILSQHPKNLSGLSPEVKLGLILTAGMAGVAANNKKKPTDQTLVDTGQPVLVN